MTERRRLTRNASPTAGQRRARRAAARSPAQPPRPLWLNPRLLLVTVAAVGIVAFVVLGFASRATAKNYSCVAEAPAPAGDPTADGVEMPDQGNQHVPSGSTIRYQLCPPTSGNHYSAAGIGPIRPGFYGPGQKAEPGGWIHDLEHGFIVVLYRGEPPSADLDALRRFVEVAPATDTAARCGYRAKIIVARFDDMSTPFAVLAWSRLLQLPAWDEATAIAFAQRWVEVAGPEPGAC